MIDKIKAKLVEYQKAKNQQRVEVFRFFLSLIQNKEIEYRTKDEDLSDEVLFRLVKKQVKNRKENIELFEKGNREDLVAKEKAELEIYKEIAKDFFPEFDLDAIPQRPFKK